jgi:hypothetical protein
MSHPQADAPLDKAVFLDIAARIVAGFEDETFRARMKAAKDAGDVAALVALPQQVQSEAFLAHGLDPAEATARFKAAGARYGADPEITPLLGRMRAALDF